MKTFVGAGTPFLNGTVHEIRPNRLPSDFHEKWRKERQEDLQMLSRGRAVESIVLREHNGPIIVELSTCSPAARQAILHEILADLELMGLHDPKQGVDDRSLD